MALIRRGHGSVSAAAMYGATKRLKTTVSLQQGSLPKGSFYVVLIATRVIRGSASEKPRSRPTQGTPMRSRHGFAAHRLQSVGTLEHHQRHGQDHRGQLHRFCFVTGDVCLGSDATRKVQKNAMEAGPETGHRHHGTGGFTSIHLREL